MFDDPEIQNHKLITNEIIQCVKDIKVLGRKDLRNLLAWRKVLNEEYKKKNNEQDSTELTEENKEEEKKSNNEDELGDIDNQIASLQEEEIREQKRKKKKVQKERLKLNERLNLKMLLKNDDGPTMVGEEMFSLKQVADANKMKKIIEQTPDTTVDSDDEFQQRKHIPKYTKYEKGEGRLDSSGFYYKDSDSELEMESENEAEIKEGLGESRFYCFHSLFFISPFFL